MSDESTDEVDDDEITGEEAADQEEVERSLLDTLTNLVEKLSPPLTIDDGQIYNELDPLRGAVREARDLALVAAYRKIRRVCDGPGDPTEFVLDVSKVGRG